MCLIIDVIYRACGCKLDRIEYCSGINPGEAHTITKAAEKEYVTLMCPTCVRISQIRKQSFQGLIGRIEMEAAIAELERSIVKA